MSLVNSHYSKLKAGYLFPEIARRVREYAEKNPQKKVIRLGIGDVVLPLSESVRAAMHTAVDEMGTLEGFKGYGPEQGYDFLREAIAAEYRERGSDISANEIFVSDGSKCDTGNIQEIFDVQCKIGMADPVYPVYVDTNVMAGRTGEISEAGYYEGLTYIPTTAENNFQMAIPSEKLNLVYLCSPNNPTGAVMTKAELTEWVAYAKKNKAIILFDAAYESFIRNPELPRSIFEIPGAKDVAIEFRSFSKNAGFTGIRCAFTVIPQGLKGYNTKGEEVSVHALWNRRHCTKFNGVSYVVQKGAAAVYSEQGKKETREMVEYYMENARLIAEGLKKLGFQVFGAENAPYIWLKTPEGFNSWQFFDELLNRCQIVGTPGSGFGPSGEGYFRLSAFNVRENVLEALQRLEKWAVPAHA